MPNIERTRTMRGSRRVQSGRLIPSGKSAKNPLVVTERPVLVGRHRACDLALSDDSVSAVHAEFVATERGVRVRDLGSRNGVGIGGALVTEAYLVEATRLTIGRSSLRFEPLGE